MACNHEWIDYQSFDKTMPRDLKKCNRCGLVLRAGNINNMKPLSYPSCGKFVAWAEDIAGNHLVDIKCTRCGAIAIRPSQCVLGIF